MARLTTEQRNYFATRRVQVANLVELDFRFGVERYWNGIHDLTFDNELWLPTGDAGKISSLESSKELRANGIELSLGLGFQEGSTRPSFQNVLPEQYKGRPARVIMAFFDEEFQTVIHSIERRYVMDVLSYDVEQGVGAEIGLKIESELLAAGRRTVRRYTDEQQRLDYPGDNAFQFLTYLASGVEIKWGTGGAFFK